jgi:hypothetical protein
VINTKEEELRGPFDRLDIKMIVKMKTVISETYPCLNLGDQPKSHSKVYINRRWLNKENSNSEMAFFPKSQTPIVMVKKKMTMI